MHYWYKYHIFIAAMSSFASFMVLLLILVEAAMPTASSIPLIGMHARRKKWRQSGPLGLPYGSCFFKLNTTSFLEITYLRLYKRQHFKAWLWLTASSKGICKYVFITDVSHTWCGQSMVDQTVLAPFFHCTLNI